MIFVSELPARSYYILSHEKLDKWCSWHKGEVIKEVATLDSTCLDGGDPDHVASITFIYISKQIISTQPLVCTLT